MTGSFRTDAAFSPIKGTMSSMDSNSAVTRNATLWVVLLLGIFAVGAVVFGVAAHSGGSEGSYGYDGMMGGGGGWGWMWGLGALMMVLPFVLLILVLVLLASPRTGASAPLATVSTDPTSEAKTRLARGEITIEEYRQLLKELSVQ